MVVVLLVDVYILDVTHDVRLFYYFFKKIQSRLFLSKYMVFFKWSHVVVLFKTAGAKMQEKCYLLL